MGVSVRADDTELKPIDLCSTGDFTLAVKLPFAFIKIIQVVNFIVVVQTTGNWLPLTALIDLPVFMQTM